MEVTGASLRWLQEQISEQMEKGFEATHARLDRLNGRVGATETTLARHDERLKTLFSRLVGKRADDPAQAFSWNTVKEALTPVGLLGLALLELLKWLQERGATP